MPTGYTNDLYEGKDISFRDFVLKCSRAMGAAIHQRDEAGDVKISKRKVDSYYYTNVASAKVALDAALATTDEEWAVAQDNAVEASRAGAEEYNKKTQERRARYEAMRDQVEAWVPPTEEHEGLRKFMLEQLNRSIDFDCSYVSKPMERVSVESYKRDQINSLRQSHERAQQRLHEEVEHVSDQHEWVDALMKAL